MAIEKSVVGSSVHGRSGRVTLPRVKVVLAGLAWERSRRVERAVVGRRSVVDIMGNVWLRASKSIGLNDVFDVMSEVRLNDGFNGGEERGVCYVRSTMAKAEAPTAPLAWCVQPIYLGIYLSRYLTVWLHASLTFPEYLSPLVSSLPYATKSHYSPCHHSFL